MELIVENVDKRFDSRSGPVVALQQTSFRVESGEFVCLLGPSGCGKSPLLFMIAGLESPSSGRILLDGQAVEGPGKERGLVFQNYTLYPWLTVRQNAAFCGELRANQRELYEGRTRSISDRVDYLLSIMGLEAFRDAYPRQLSGGMKQRVAIARTLVNRPKLMLMDEPFGALDSQTREEMQELLLLLARHEKMTVVFVTHDVDEAIFLGSRVLTFSRRPGRVLQDTPIPFSGVVDFSVKMAPEFLALKRSLLDLLHSQAEASAARHETLARLVAMSANDSSGAT